MNRTLLRIFRSLLTVILLGTMAVMVYSLQAELKSAKARIRELSGAHKDGVYVLCKMNIKPDADLGFYRSRTLSLIPIVRAEHGCQMYSFLEDANTDWDAPQRGGDRTLWMVEKWDSVEALKAHLNTNHMKEYGSSVKDMRESSTFRVLQEAH